MSAVWKPEIGDDAFEEIVYCRLSAIAATHTRNKKTYNNVVSTLRCAFEFGYKDHPHKHNPAAGLNTLRITKKDRPPIDPFTIEEGERIIAASHAEFGAAHGNYEEFRFFTGLRQSEQIALTLQDCDTTRGTININKAVVLGKEKDRTKTREDREIALCGRALQVLKRQLKLRKEMAQAGFSTISSSFRKTARPSSISPTPMIAGAMLWSRGSFAIASHIALAIHTSAGA